MRMRSAFVAGLCIAVFAIGSSRAQTKAPYEIVRSVQALHDQMALGNRAAQAAMPGLLRQLADKLVAAGPSAWQDPRNTRAIVVYILSGGEIRVAQKVLDSGKCAASEKRLIEGALAYLEGDKDDAKALLDRIDPRSLEPAVGSYIALAQAALIAQDHAERAIRLLDIARVLAPGTLVEDAALRREVFLAEQTANYAKFVDMSEQYLRRFRRSVYAESFRRSFAAAVVRMGLVGNADQLADLVDLVNALSPHEQLQLYLRMAQTAVVSGKIEAARWASKQAAQLAPQNSIEARRALLYDGVASVLTKDYDHGLGELENLDAKHLSHADRELEEAALGVAQEIRQWPKSQLQTDKKMNEPAATQSDRPPSQQADRAGAVPAALAATIDASDVTIANAQKMLAESDTALEGQEQ